VIRCKSCEELVPNKSKFCSLCGTRIVLDEPPEIEVSDGWKVEKMQDHLTDYPSVRLRGPNGVFLTIGIRNRGFRLKTSGATLMPEGTGPPNYEHATKGVDFYMTTTSGGLWKEDVMYDMIEMIRNVQDQLEDWLQMRDATDEDFLK